MRILLKMTAVQFKMLLRDRGLLVGSLGLAVVSMLIFGWLFGSTNTSAWPLGVVDLDRSPVSAGIIESMKHNEALAITQGDEQALVDQLSRGKLTAVVVLKPGFGAGVAHGGAHVVMYIQQVDPILAERDRGMITAIFDRASKQAAGFKDTIQVTESTVAVREERQIDFLAPGMLGMTIMFANLYVGMALIGWRERGTLKRLAATPLKSWQLIGSQMLSRLALSFAQVIILLAIAILVFNVQFSADWIPNLALFTAAGTFSMVALGYAVGNFVQRREAAQSVALLIGLPMMFLGGSYFQVAPPAFLQPVVEILPLTHLNRALREIMLNTGAWDTLWVSLAVLLAFGVVLLTFSIRTFKWSWGK